MRRGSVKVPPQWRCSEAEFAMKVADTFALTGHPSAANRQLRRLYASLARRNARRKQR